MNARNQYSLTGSAPEMYERNMVPAIFAPFAKGLLEFANLLAGEYVLEVAHGTGIVARLAWPQVAPSGHVVGLDVNAAMLEVARSASEEVGAPIAWQEGDIAWLPMADGAFDVSLCRHGLQYFPDRHAALTEMHRMLRASGRLVLSVWRPCPVQPRACRLCGRLGASRQCGSSGNAAGAVCAVRPGRNPGLSGWCGLSRDRDAIGRTRGTVSFSRSDGPHHDGRHAACHSDG
jgi:SAM-dependent methyltransferase